MSGLYRAENGKGHDCQHYDDVDAQSPKQELCSSAKLFPAEVGAALGSDNLIRFEQR